MKFITSILMALAFATNTAFAEDILSELKSKKEGQGEVTVNQSSEIRTMLDKKKAEWANKKQLTFSGYRVQVFMGNQQKKSKDDATDRERNIKAKYPELSTYLSFSSPFWKLKVGDFRTHADALIVANKLKNDFSKWEGDIYIVRDSEVYNTDFDGK